MYSPTLERTIAGWTPLADTLIVPHTEAEYERLVTMLDELIDTVGENEAHPLAGLMETIGALIESYEDRTVVESEGEPLTTLRFLMREHGVTANDLPELGSATAVQQLLDGAVALTPSQIQLLAKRFHVSPLTFL